MLYNKRIELTALGRHAAYAIVAPVRHNGLLLRRRSHGPMLAAHSRVNVQNRD